MKANTLKKSSAAKTNSNSQFEFETLILENRESGRKLARSLLRRWRVYMPLEELNSIVDLTLCEAAGRYSAEHGAAFMTFFFYHLRGNLVRTITRITKHNSLVSSVDSSIPESTAVQCNSANNSMQVQTESNHGISFSEVEMPENLLLRKERIELCREAWSKLDDLEREVLSRSFSDETALIDIASELGYSRCHISRVKKRALQRLKFVYSELDEGIESTETNQLPAGNEPTATGSMKAAVNVSTTLASRRGRRRRELPTHLIRRRLAGKKAVNA